MPLVKHHDTLTDLIKKGAEKKQSLHDERRKQSAYYAGWTLDEKPENVQQDSKGVPLVDPDETDKFLPISALFLWAVEMKFIKYARCFALIGAFFILTIDASTNPESVAGLVDFVYPLDYVVNVYYIIDGGLKMLSMYTYLAIAKNCSQALTMTTYFRRSGIVDVPLSVFCLIYSNDTGVNKWLHLVRCMTLSLFFLEQTPQIDVLMSGITAGLKSTLYTWSLMILIFLVFAATGVIFFKDNDPYHFGNIGMAMWSYFEMTTLDNWSDVLNVNYHGCDQFNAGYYEPGSGFQKVKTDYGEFYLPVCAKPSQHPLVASALFTFFILMCGFVMVSLTVAFVTTGINNKLRMLKEEEDKMELLVEQGHAPSNKSNCGDKPLKKRRPSIVQTALNMGKAGIERSLSNRNLDVDGTSSSFGFGLSRRFGSKDSGESDMSPKSVKRSNSGVSVESTDSNSDRTASRGFFSSRDRMKKEKEKEESLASKNIIADPDLLRALLTQVWKTEDGDSILKDESLSSSNLQRRKGMLIDAKKVGKFNAKSFKMTMKNINRKNVQRSDLQKWLMRVGVHMRNVVGNKYYVYGVSVVIVIAAVVQLLTVEERIDPLSADVIGILCQVAFTFDLVFKFLSCSPKYTIFFENSWNVFDTVLVFFLWIPILAVGAPNIVYFELLKIMRIIRVLKIFSWIVEVNIIMKSISTSARCLAYVVFLMIVFFYHFGVAGVYLFSNNDPFHFGNIGKALLTLFQISTLDDWSDIARMNMYGCLYIGYDPDLCDEEDSYGWGWVAAWYFIVFVIVGVMVLVALFVGVIITSMELLQLSIREEAEMLTKVAAKQAEFGITDTCAHTLLEIFDMIDVCANGRLTLHELKPILGMVSLKESQQYELFHKIDEDMSGKIDFAEFVELIHLMNLAFAQKTKSAAEQKKSSSNVRGWLRTTPSGKSGMLNMLANSFRPKKSLKTVAKMSILASRMKKSASATGFNTDTDPPDQGRSLSRLSEASEDSKTSKTPTRSSSKGWSAVLEKIKSLKADASVEIGKVPSQDPASDMSPSLQNQWFGGSATVVPDISENDVVAFKPIPARKPVQDTAPILSQKYNGPLANFNQSSADFDIVPFNSDERFSEDGSMGSLGDPRRGFPPPKMATFNMDDVSRSAPMADDTGPQRPATSGAPGMRLESSSLAFINGSARPQPAHLKYRTLEIPGSPTSSVGSSGGRRKKKSKLSPEKKPATSDEPNLFFSYTDGGSGRKKKSPNEIHL